MENTVTNAADRLTAAIKEKGAPCAVGLDTALDFLPEEMTRACDSAEGAAAAVAEFNYRVIESVRGLAPAVKVQVAYYEALGWQGMRAFADTLKYARENGLIAIADCKRNDIASTAGAYASAFLGGAAFGAFECDFLTVNGYLGADGIKPFTDECAKRGKGVFVLCKTSNPGSGQLQDLKLDGTCAAPVPSNAADSRRGGGRTLYEAMGGLINEWGAGLVGQSGYSAVGAVVGATHPAQAAVLRKLMPRAIFLVPGYGAQGGTAEGLRPCFNADGTGAVVNSSRAILCAYRSEKYKGMKYYEAARAATEDMVEDLRRLQGIDD
ncbi:MAG: orotidine-5'-phosphate decarboxylase [Clostridiales bacterium]|jgi:orotidine-5'-phosphate decarboxylase|nr:orotidine-5'-phosphate decarboxylase [Clostridiales bacterium]